MQVEQQEALQARVALLEKRLKAAETQCQATTKEIWQMEVELARTQDLLREAEQALENLPAAADSSALETQLEEALQTAAELEQRLKEAQASRNDLEQRLEEALQAEKDLQSTLFQVEEEARSQLSESAEHLQEMQQALQEQEARLANLSQANQQVSELQQQLVEAHSMLARSQQERDELKLRVEALRQELAETIKSQALTSTDTAELERLKEHLRLQQERSALLQEKFEQLQQRHALTEEKAQLYQQKAHEAEARLVSGQGSDPQALAEVQGLREKLERMESRVREADRVYEAAEAQVREAEQNKQESWQRVRDAEMRANQALVENKKLTDRLSELERRTQESDRETQRLAFQDPLTGLPNLNLITQYLEFTVKQCVRYRRVAAILEIDIDRFKVFNEAMGQKAGDELLQRVAERLQQAIRDTDSLGRKGEDEFIILLSELNVGEHPSPDARVRAIHQHVEVVAHRVTQMMATPFTVQGQKFNLDVSIGIAICPDDGDTPQSLLENADTAMYHVKETGRNRHQFYTHDLRRRQEKRLTLDMQLRSALERGEFEVRYHPVVSLGKGKGTMVGVESLLRWNHRIEGTVSPDYFLPAAEESGMIIPIGNWVLQQTCRQMREWLSQGLRIFSSINLSKRQLLQADLAESLVRELAQNGIPAEALYVEIAEGFNTFNPEMMDQIIQRLGSTGIRIAIDDFGIGYSNLSKVNLNYTRLLKIDRSILQGCPHDRQSSTVCIAAINLASSLGLLSLAEGVENLNQVKFLIKYGCSLAQGYYFSEPVTPNEISQFHKSKKVWKV